MSTMHGVQGAPTISHVKDWHLSFTFLLPVKLQDSDQMDVDGDPVTTPNSDLSPDWVDVSMWEVLIEQLRDLMVLQRLLQIKLNKVG